MNKLFVLFLFALFFIGINCTDCEAEANGVSEEECWYRKLSDDQTHCCYVPEDDESKQCWSLSDDEYENIKRYKDYAKVYYNMEELTIKCSANFISVALFILSLFALLF